MKKAFQKVAQAASATSGSPWAFLLAFAVVSCWAVTGPFFGFSDTWQLVINTGTTIVTFLMVFLIQNTQNRDTVAMHAKLDELIIKLQAADNELVGAEELSDEDLSALIEREKRTAKAAEKVPSPASPKVKRQAEELKEGAVEELQRRKSGAGGAGAQAHGVARRRHIRPSDGKAS